MVRELYGLAGFHFDKEPDVQAAKLFRAAVEYGNHGESQNLRRDRGCDGMMPSTTFPKAE